MSQYLDENGLRKLWSKTKAYVNDHVPSLTWDQISGKPDFSAVYRYKGTVATVSALPSSGNEVGDVWDVQSNNMNYGWTGDHWDPLGEIFVIESISDETIDEITGG